MALLCTFRGNSHFTCLAALLALCVGGCANPDVAATLPLTQAPPFSPSGEVFAPVYWWTAFENPALDYQVDMALGANFDLAAAWERMRAARALARREATDLWPDVDFFALSEGVFRSDGPEEGNFALGLDGSYQVDLWGQIRSRVEAERLRADASLEDYQAIALALSADVAGTWFALIEAHAQLALLNEQIETNLVGLELQRARFALGRIRLADVLRQQQLVEATREQAVIVQSRIAVLQHVLAVLQGQAPQHLTYETGAALPPLPALPYAGLPSELLNRRPDVRREFLALQAADRDLASAVSAQYPRVDLTASVLTAAESPEKLFHEWIASTAGQLVAPLFDAGQRRAEVYRNAAIVRQRFAEYAQTVLFAYQEVEDALAREEYLQERIARLDAQLDLAHQASMRLREQYLIGEVDYLDVLSAITGEQRLQRDTLSARLDLILNRIALYLALAGDFTLSRDIEIPSQSPIEELPPPEHASDE